MMEFFLCDIFDFPTKTDLAKYNIIPQVLDINAGTLLYKCMYSHPRVRNNLLYSWVYRKFFGCFPSKLRLSLVGGNYGDFERIVSHITDTTFIKYVSKSFEKHLQLWRSEFEQYKIRLQADKTSKLELGAKLLDRLTCTDPVGRIEYDGELSLYQLYKQVVFAESKKLTPEQFYVQEQKTINDTLAYKKNPVTNFYLQNPVASFDDEIDNHTYMITYVDAVKEVFVQDNYFMRLIFNTNVCISLDASNVLSSTQINGALRLLAKQGYLLLTNDGSNSSHYQGTSFFTPYLRNLIALIPPFMQKCVIISNQSSEYVSKSLPNGGGITFFMTSLTDLKPDGRLSIPCIAVPKFFHQGCFLFNTCDTDDAIIGSAEYVEYAFDLALKGHPTLLVLPYFLEMYMNLRTRANRFNKLIKTSPSSVEQNCVVMIDSRANPMSAMAYVITAANLDPTMWHLIIYTSDKAAQFYKRVFDKNISSIEVRTYSTLNKDVFNLEDYNVMLKSASFWTELEQYKYCLIIQDDGILLRQGVEGLLDVIDYVGAPWADAEVNKELKTITNPMLVGNGGLSLRNVKKTLEIVRDESSAKNMLFNNSLQPIPEDVFFALEFYKRGYKIPSRDQASLFSSEQVLNMESIGIHKPWAYNEMQQIHKFMQKVLSDDD